MSEESKIRAVKVTDEAGRQQALSVYKVIYCQEKNWVGDESKMFDAADLKDDNVSWFVALSGDRPVGVLRVLYALPMDLYKQYGFKMLEGSFDLDAFVRENKIAEIGRFAVLPEERRNIMVAGMLMKAAVKDTVERGFTHYVTDIFEGEEHSPYLFHTRVMGFVPVATHDVGELNCPNRRITMVLDIAACYRKLKKSSGWIFRILTGDWSEELHRKLKKGTD